VTDGGQPIPWWLAGAGVPALFLDDDDGSLIPEPNSMVLFAAGGIPLLALWLRRRKDHRDSGPR
jgi:hypothetical protein